MLKKVLATLTALTLAVATFASLTTVSATGIGDDFDGWRYIWQGGPDGNNNPHTWYRNGNSGAMFFNALDVDDIQQLFLNTDVAGISNDNTAKFGKDNMKNFTVEFDMRATGINGDPAQVSFAFNGSRGDHLNDHSIQLRMNNSCSAMFVEAPNGDTSRHYCGPLVNSAGEQYNVNNPLITDGAAHHISIQKAENRVVVIVDNNADEPFFDVTLPVDLMPNFDLRTETGYMGFTFRNAQGYIANVKVTNDTTNVSKTFFEDYCDEWDWVMGGKNKDDGMAMLPSKGANGSGVYGKSVGEIDDSHTTTQYVQLLDLNDFTFEFTPQVVTYTEDDPDAWMGFAITNSDKDFSISNTNKGTGFVMEMQVSRDGTDKLVFKSLLEDEDYGKHSVTVDTDIQVGTTYKLAVRDTDEGTKIYYVAGEEETLLATLDWMKGNFSHHMGYFTFTGSVTKENESMEWVVNTMNGEAAAGYKSAAVMPKDPETPPTDDNDTPSDTDSNVSDADDTISDADDKNNDADVTETGISSVAITGAFMILLLSGCAMVVMRKRANK